jgi:hypothetical protein
MCVSYSVLPSFETIVSTQTLFFGLVLLTPIINTGLGSTGAL